MSQIVDTVLSRCLQRVYEPLQCSCGNRCWCVQTKPFLSYGVLVVNLAVYMAGLGLRFSLGESSGEDYFYMLAKVNDEVVQGEYYRYRQQTMSHAAPCKQTSTVVA